MECELCHMELQEIFWNSNFDVAVCNNWKCTKFRQPAAKIFVIKNKRKTPGEVQTPGLQEE
jgi:hypothetical protein